MLVDFDVRRRQRTFAMYKYIYIQYYEFWPGVAVKLNALMMDCFLETRSFSLPKTLTDGRNLRESSWCFFISCFDSHSDGTHSLQMTIGELCDVCYISPNLFTWKTNSSISWMAWGWVQFQQILFLGELYLKVEFDTEKSYRINILFKALAQTAHIVVFLLG